MFQPHLHRHGSERSDTDKTCIQIAAPPNPTNMMDSPVQSGITTLGAELFTFNKYRSFYD